MIDKPLSYYKWFWQDFRANRKVQRMSYIERGLYRELLDECWADGSLPNDIPELAEICGCPDDVMANAWQVLSKCFIDRGDGRLVNDKLESLRTDTDKTRLARAESGKKGAIAKQMPSNSSANASNCHIEEKRREEKRIDRSPKGSRLPADWKPSEEDISYCKQTRPDLDPDRVAEDFADYWHGIAGQKGVKLDWPATWRGWVRKQFAQGKKQAEEPREWHETASGVDSKAKELGLPSKAVDEQFPAYRARVMKAASGNGHVGFKSIGELWDMAQQRNQA